MTAIAARLQIQVTRHVTLDQSHLKNLMICTRLVYNSVHYRSSSFALWIKL